MRRPGRRQALARRCLQCVGCSEPHSSTWGAVRCEDSLRGGPALAINNASPNLLVYGVLAERFHLRGGQ